jgi:glucose-1-phosphate adenylyltransferase
MGIYVFNRKAMADALDNTMADFGKEIIPGLLGKKKLFAYIFEGYWEDIGTVRAFFEANLALAQPLPPFNFFDPVRRSTPRTDTCRLRSSTSLPRMSGHRQPG